MSAENNPECLGPHTLSFWEKILNRIDSEDIGGTVVPSTDFDILIEMAAQNSQQPNTTRSLAKLAFENTLLKGRGGLNGSISIDRELLQELVDVVAKPSATVTRLFPEGQPDSAPALSAVPEPSPDAAIVLLSQGA